MRVDAFGHPLKSDTHYYIQDTRQVVGNCVLWWATGSKGYTCDLKEAEKYLGDEASTDRDTDVPWPVDIIEANIVIHIRVEPLRRLREARQIVSSEKPARRSPMPPSRCDTCKSLIYLCTCMEPLVP